MRDNKKSMNQQKRGNKSEEQMKPTSSNDIQIAEMQQDLVQYQQPINQQVQNHARVNTNDLPVPLISLLTLAHTSHIQPSQVITLLNKSLLNSHHLLHPEQLSYSNSHKCRVIRQNLWYSLFFQTENSEEVRGNRRMMDVMIKGINSMVKRNRVIEVLYYMWLSNIPRQANLRITSQLQYCLIQIFTLNPHLTKQLYYLIDSSSQLASTHIQPSHFLPCFTLLTKLTSTTASNHYFMYCLSQLSFWFSLQKDHLLPMRFCHLRYNLIAKLLEQVSEEDLVQYNNGEILANVTQGIQSRLIDLKYYDAALLVWNKLAKKLGLELDEGVKTNVRYFENQMRNSIAIEPSKITNSPLEENEDNLVDQHNDKSNNIRKTINPSTTSEPCMILYNSPQTNFKKPLITQIASFSSQQNKSQQGEKIQFEEQFTQFSQENLQQQSVVPMTLHDCLFSLRNPLRRNLALSSLCPTIQRHPQDVVLVWRQLLTSLLHPLESQCQKPLIKLFLIRPNPWIKDVGEMYFKKDLSLNEKVVFCELLQQAINQMGEINSSSRKNEDSCENDPSQQFYFKRVSSKYLAKSSEPSPLKPQPQKTRRWGHTRILHQQKSSNPKSLPSMLLITSASTNRLHEVILQLYFTIVFRLLSQIENKVVKEPILAQHLVRVMSTICQNLKTFYQKYTILEDVSEKCLEVVKKISATLKPKSPSIATLSNPIQNYSPLILSLIQCLNKLTLCLDHHCPSLILQSLKTTIQLLKSLDIYNIRPLVELVQANVYQNVIISQKNNQNKQGGLSMFMLN